MNNLLSKIVHLIIIALLFSTVSCKKKDKPDLSKAFVKYYGGISADNGAEVLQTSDGGYVVAGTSNTGTSADIIIIKTDAQGNQSWQRTFGGPNYDECGSVAIMPDGGYILIGTYGKTSRQWNVNALEATKDSTVMYAIRLDASGNTIWEYKYPSSTPYTQVGTFGRAVVVNAAGECMLAGMLDSSYVVPGGNLFVNLDLYALIVDQNGILLKVGVQDIKIFHSGSSTANDIVNSATEAVSTGLGHEYVISSSSALQVANGGGTPYTPRIVSFRLNGLALLQNAAATKTDWGPEVLYYNAGQISKTNDNNYILTGDKGTPPSSSDIYMIKLSGSLGVTTKISNWTYGDLSGSDDEGVSVVPTTDGGYAILGTSNSVIYTGNTEKLNDVILIKTDQNGVEQWHKVFGGRGNDIAARVIQTRDGGYLICGTISFGEDGSAPGSANSITLIKLNSDGDISNVK